MPEHANTQLLDDEQLDSLAARVLCEPRDTDEWARLLPQIKILCRRVSRRRVDYLDEVTQETAIKIEGSCGTDAQYRRERRFRSWCWKIARNVLNDLERGRASRRLGSLTPDLHAEVATVEWGPLYDDGNLLSAADARASEELFRKSPETAVQVFAISWLWTLLPPNIWMKWLIGVGIAQPWPPVNLLQAPNPRVALLSCVAEGFGITPDAVRRNVERRRDFLLSLERVKAALGYKE